jgi:hypothetical protein
LSDFASQQSVNRRDELLALVREVKKGSMITSGVTGFTYWKFDNDSESKIVDNYLKAHPEPAKEQKEWHDAVVKLADDLRAENIELKKLLNSRDAQFKDSKEVKPVIGDKIRCSNCGELIGNCDMSCWYADKSEFIISQQSQPNEPIKEVKPSDDMAELDYIATRRNNSTLSYIDCCMRLTGDRPFEEMTDDDLDSIYAVAFGHWAYHLTRQGYIDALNKRRLDNKITLK